MVAQMVGETMELPGSIKTDPKEDVHTPGDEDFRESAREIRT